jgi:Na+/H+ antiporter NhaD/arsenite permease-like protein
MKNLRLKAVWFYSFIFLLLLPLLPSECLATQAPSSHAIFLSSLWWAFPFFLVLFSLAFFPLIVPKLWHSYYGRIMALYTIPTLLLLFTKMEYPSVVTFIVEIIAHHYLPFLLLIGALYITAGGIRITFHASPSAINNTLILAVATFVAGWIGTTGASMLFIRPFLKLNQNRPRRQYLVIFFIILVGNVGGGLTPLGDPPLFLGYLEGISFFWPLKNLALPILLLSVPLLIVFYLWDQKFQGVLESKQKCSVQLEGKQNILYGVAIIFLILVTSIGETKLCFDFLGVSWKLQHLIRDGGLALIAFLSYFKTNPQLRRENDFMWAPLKEVAIIFAAIFITVSPVLEMLKAGHEGPFHSLFQWVHYEDGTPSSLLYFWVTGLFSSILDNAPTYLVFFNMAGGDPSILMSTLNSTLVAISAGSVFMGALTYIGNAPNFMIKAIAESHEIKMPNFFSYALQASLLLIPLLILISFLFFN